MGDHLSDLAESKGASLCCMVPAEECHVGSIDDHGGWLCAPAHMLLEMLKVMRVALTISCNLGESVKENGPFLLIQVDHLQA